MAKLISSIPALSPVSVVDSNTGKILSYPDWLVSVQELLLYVKKETQLLFDNEYINFEKDVLAAKKLGSMNSFARQRGYKSRYQNNLPKNVKAKSRINELVIHKFASETTSYILNPNPKKQAPNFNRKINLGAVDKQMAKIDLDKNIIILKWKVWDRELTFEFILPEYILKRNISKICLPTVEYKKDKIVFIFAVEEMPKEREIGRQISGIDLGRVEPYTMVVVNSNGKRDAHYTTSIRLKDLNSKRERIIAENKHIFRKIKSYESLGLNATTLKLEKRFNDNKIKTIGNSLAQQLGAEIAKKLDKHKIDFIYLENLKWVTGKKYGSRWNHSRQQTSIEHATLRIGIRTKKVSPKNTSRKCYKCNAKIIYNSKKRLVHCIDCKTKIDRDYNAAMNIALNKKCYPTTNRMSGDSCSDKKQAMYLNDANSILAKDFASKSFIT